MLIKTARLQSHYCLYLMVPIAILFNVLIGYGINVHVSKKPEKTEYFVDRCLSFFFWSLCCLSFYLQILTSPLVSSNSS